MARRKMQTPTLFVFDKPGVAAKGYLTRKETQIIQGNTVGRYVLRGDDGTHVINGTVVIDDGMIDVVVGEWVEIQRTPDIATGTGMTMRQFDIYTGKEDVADAKK